MDVGIDVFNQQDSNLGFIGNEKIIQGALGRDLTIMLCVSKSCWAGVSSSLAARTLVKSELNRLYGSERAVPILT